MARADTPSPRLDFVERRLTRPDGRIVAWTEAGAARGNPLLRIPGTPASRIPLRSGATPWLTRNVRMIVTERPGFGASTRLAGHGFAEHAEDLVAILDHLGIGSLAAAAGSGGAPYLLALMANHPERVSAATVVSGMGQVDPEDADALTPLNAAFLRLTRAGDWAGLRDLLSAARDAHLADPLASLRARLASAPAEDKALIEDPRFQAAYVRTTTEALRLGVDGWVDECAAIGGDWHDVRLDRVRGSLTWWHSRQDRNAPFTAATRLLQQIPDATLRVWSDGGHLTAFHKEVEVMDELLGRAEFTGRSGTGPR